MQLSFENLRAANVRRGAQWDGKPAALDDLSFRAMELGGECGEALNVAKKLVRQLSGRVGGLTLEEARPMLAEELADVVICADRVAELLGIDLETAITEKFNKTSLKHGLVMMQECMTDADLDRLIAGETKKENEFLHSLLSAFEWQRINSMHISEVEKELHEAGYTKERLDAGLAKCRAMVEAALAKRAADSAREVEQLPGTDGDASRKPDSQPPPEHPLRDQCILVERCQHGQPKGYLCTQCVEANEAAQAERRPGSTGGTY